MMFSSKNRMEKQTSNRTPWSCCLCYLLLFFALYRKCSNCDKFFPAKNPLRNLSLEETSCYLFSSFIMFHWFRYFCGSLIVYVPPFICLSSSPPVWKMAFTAEISYSSPYFSARVLVSCQLHGQVVTRTDSTLRKSPR